MKQETINFNAESILRKCKASTQRCTVSDVTWKRFRHCNAYISSCIGNRYFLVKSYSAVVAVIDDQNGDLYELGKWTRTTSKQVTQIYNMTDFESFTNYGFTKLVRRYLCK